MNSLRLGTMGMLMLLAGAVPAWAVDTSKTYSSGLLVGIFLGFCALVVIVQLLPTIMLLVGFVKGLFQKTAKQSSRLNGRG